MGGSAKQVRDKVAKETGYTGSDLDKGVQHVGKKGAEVIEGAKEHGGAMATGLGQGLGKLGTEAMSGLKHNLDQVANVAHALMGNAPGGGGGNTKAQSAVGQYSSQKGRAKARKGKGGDLAGQDKKRVSGKQKLFVRR